MKKLALLCSLVIIVLTACSVEKPAPLPEKVVIDYFYNEPCAACDTLDEFWEMVREELKDVKEQYTYTVNTYNIFKLNDAASKDKTLTNLGLSEDEIRGLTYPLMHINGKLYSGNEEIKKALKEAYLTAGEDIFVYKKGVYNPVKAPTLNELTKGYTVEKNASTIVYFYRSVCEECIETKEDVISKLPEKVDVNGKSTPVQLISINTRSGNNGDLLTAFFEKYQVTDKDQMVPIVFTTNGYLAGYESISKSLITQLESGAGLSFKMPTE